MTPGSLPCVPATDRARRTRPILSCLTYRRRKLKCDREWPCNQCTKVARTDQCVYEDINKSTKRSSGDAELEEHNPSLRPPSRISHEIDSRGPAGGMFASATVATAIIPSSDAKAIDALQSRISKLEALLVCQTRTIELLQDNRYPTPRTIPGIIVARSDSIQPTTVKKDNGPTFSSEFDDALQFIEGTFRNPTMLPILSNLKSYHYRFRESDQLCKERSDPENISITSRILTALPSRTFCDRAVAFYMQHFEKVYRILHVPTFMQDYSMVWETNNACTLQLENFIPQLAALVAIVSVLDANSPQTSPSTSEELSLGTTLFGLVDEWLRRSVSRKQLLVDAVRVRTLLQLARLMRLDRTKAPHNVWVSTGGLVRFAISQDLHRDPNDLPGISISKANRGVDFGQWCKRWICRPP